MLAIAAGVPRAGLLALPLGAASLRRVPRRHEEHERDLASALAAPC